jgi:16S rRNA (adenine1518-N6/adenine1519-N6)-dimethyltransferase
MFFEIRKEFIVKPGSFFPVPKVDSVVLSFVPLARSRYPLADEELFKRLVKAAFGQRRKTLWNCLKGSGFAPSDELLRERMQSVAIEPARRGETLSLDEFAALANALSAA